MSPSQQQEVMRDPGVHMNGLMEAIADLERIAKEFPEAFTPLDAQDMELCVSRLERIAANARPAQ